MPTRTVRDLMTADPTCCTPQDSITQVARRFLEEDCGALPVVESVESRRLIGMITDRDITVRIVAKDLNPAECTVQQAMTSEAATVNPNASVDECLVVMMERQVRRVPVVDEGGRVVGIVAQADLARASAADPTLENELADTVEEISEPAGRG